MARINYLYGNYISISTIQDDCGNPIGRDVHFNIDWTPDHEELANQLRLAADWLEENKDVDLELNVD